MNREDQRKWVLNARWILLKSWPSKKDLISQSLQTENFSRKDIIFSRKNGFFSLDQTAKDTIRASVANILKTCKVPATVNITKQ